MASKAFLETVKAEGLSHLSYIVGGKGQAAVIDPRRDCEIYLDIAHRHGAAITHIFETHRNEDYVIGSQDLSRRTGAVILHGKALDFRYGQGVSEGESFDFGPLRLRVLETPGHTFESISLALSEISCGDTAVGVFTGDALFVGDVGRTDFFPDRAEEVAGLLYDSLFGKLLGLGDQAIIYPAHGGGSVCGSGISAREFSTIGHERRCNRRLQAKSREEFVEWKIREHHYHPPYFRLMEKYNQEGPPPLHEVPRPSPMSVRTFEQGMQAGMTVLDVRPAEAFAGAFVPGSLSIPMDMLSAYAGYLLSHEETIGLVAADYDAAATAVRYLLRMGFDNVLGHLEGGLHAWTTAGRRFGSIPGVHIEEVERRRKGGEQHTVLDVRKIDEWSKGHLPGAKHIFLGELAARLGEISQDKPVVTFCGSGRRAMIAASILRRHGFERVENNFGSMSARKAVGCELEKP